AGSMQRRQRTVLTLVLLRDVHPNPDQPRKHFDEEKLGELAASIKAHGLLQPIVVRPTAAGLEIVAGERRFRAAQLAGLDRLPALVREVEDPLELALIENLQREDLSPLEEAEGLADLIARHGYSHREVAELLGKSRPYVSNILALTRLPEAVKADLQRDGGAVSRELLMGVARQEDPETALALWRRLQLGVLSVRRFREEKAGHRPERAAAASHGTRHAPPAPQGRRRTDGDAGSEKVRRAGGWFRTGTRDDPSVAVLRSFPDRRVPSAREAADAGRARGRGRCLPEVRC